MLQYLLKYATIATTNSTERRTKRLLMENFVRDENRVYSITYHLGWFVQRKKPVLVDEIKNVCENLIRQSCELMGWKIIKLEIMPNYVNLIIQTYPKDSAFEVIKRLRLATSTELKTYSTIKTLPGVWTKKYFAATISTDEEIEREIERFVELESELRKTKRIINSIEPEPEPIQGQGD